MDVIGCGEAGDKRTDSVQLDLGKGGNFIVKWKWPDSTGHDADGNEQNSVAARSRA